MVLVNNPGSTEQTYAWLVHAKWQGWTFADTIFPAFLWIVGVAITLSTARRVELGESRGDLLFHAARRSAMLYVCGLALEGLPHFDLASWQVTGVLQKTSVAYLLALVIFLWTTWRGQACALLISFAIYLGVMVCYPVPDCSSGLWSAECNVARYVDGLVLDRHTWMTPTHNDPDGVVSVLSSTTTVLLGMLVGQMMRRDRAAARRARALLVSGIVLVVMGGAMSRWIPVSKILWTPSFAVLMAGLSSLAFGALHWAVEGQNLGDRFKPIEIFGLNAIAAYIASRLIALPLKVHLMGKSLYGDLFLPIVSPVNASLLFALLNVLCVYLLVWWMYRRRIFVKF